MYPYNHHYVQLNFERAGLFKAIRDQYVCREVLYPGCSVHITPSLYFPHVIYVDQSETAAQFFTHEKEILEFVNRNRTYKQSAHVRFLQRDYTQPLPLQEGTFDLLVSIFAGGIARSCARYLKKGGLLLTNNHQGDAFEAVRSKSFKAMARAQFQKGKYVLAEENLPERNIPAQKRTSEYLRQANKGLEYTEKEVYYLLQFTPSKR